MQFGLGRNLANDVKRLFRHFFGLGRRGGRCWDYGRFQVAFLGGVVEKVYLRFGNRVVQQFLKVATLVGLVGVGCYC